MQYSHFKDLDNQVKVRKRLKVYYEKQGNGNNAIQNKNILNTLEKKILLEKQKLGKRKAVRLRQLAEMRGELS